MRNMMILIAVAMLLCFSVTSYAICTINQRMNTYEKAMAEAITDIYLDVRRIDDNSVDMRGFVRYVEEKSSYAK